MDVDMNRRGWPRRSKNIDLLDIRRAVRNAEGSAETSARQFAVTSIALLDLRLVRRVGGLIIRGVEFDLVVTEKNIRPVVVRRRPDALLGTKEMP